MTHGCGAGVDFPCWIVLDVYNQVELDNGFDFESPTPLGSFSPACPQIALVAQNAAAARKFAGVTRS
jgi:hypothetical protein